MPLDLSFDPLDVPASLDDLKATVLLILEADVSLPNGEIYQFSDVDERKMRKAQRGLSEAGVSINWRQSNNDETLLDAVGMLSLIGELDSRQFLRGVVVDTEYMSFKLSGSYTKRQLADWKSKYANGFIP